ncbi:YcdB/YcdC domain-containing protein [Brevibacillus sp. NPDC003359]|uniref:YcdB/YcdC domain-containing protein n=1 Tax=unclassified Brevibacillus TaxID=2684853 RepID=UPI00369335BE
MKHKWKGTAFVFTAMLLGASTQALAATPETIMKSTASTTTSEVKLPAGAEKVVATLEKLEPGFKVLTKRSVEVVERYENLVRLYMEKPDDEYSNATVYFDRKTGELISLEVSINNGNKGKTEKATDEVILQRAETFVQELLGADKRKLTGAPQLYQAEEDNNPDAPLDEDAVYRLIYYPALLNGLKLDESDFGIRVVTDYAGHLVELTFNPIDLKGASVPDPKKALSPAAIQKQIFTPDRLDYGYIGEGKDGKPTLEYILRTSPVFDAISGKQIDGQRGTQIEDGKRNATNHKNVTIKPQAKPLIANSAEEAEKIVVNLFGVDTKKAYSHYKKEEYGDNIAHYWTEEYQDRFASLTVDKSTGQVSMANNWTITEEIPVPLTEEQAMQKAIAFIEPYVEAADWQVEIIEPEKDAPLADWMIKLYEEEGTDVESSNGLYGFSFKQLHHGVPIIDNYYWVMVDVATGHVVRMETSLPIKDRTYPVLKPTVTEQQAAEILGKNIPLELSYTWTTFYGERAPYLTLVYTLDTSKGWPYVDAISGSFQWSEYEEE